MKSIILKNKAKSIFAIIAIMFLGGMIAGCDDGNNNNTSFTPNQFTHDGETFAVKNGAQVFYGHYDDYGDESNNIDLYILGDDYMIVFEMFVPNESNRLVSGKYVKSGNYKPFTFVVGVVFDNHTDDAYELTECSINISVSGDKYIIDIDGSFYDKTTLKGNFTGELIWEDQSGGAYPGVMTLNIDGETETVGFNEGTQLALGDSGNPGSYFLINFPGGNFKLSLSFRNADANATSLPAGTYTFTGEAAREVGKAYAALNIDEVGLINSTSGTARVSKNGSNYNIEFQFNTQFPNYSVSGRYSGALPLTSPFDYKSISSEPKAYKSTIIKKLSIRDK